MTTMMMMKETIAKAGTLALYGLLAWQALALVSACQTDGDAAQDGGGRDAIRLVATVGGAGNGGAAEIGAATRALGTDALQASGSFADGETFYAYFPGGGATVDATVYSVAGGAVTPAEQPYFTGATATAVGCYPYETGDGATAPVGGADGGGNAVVDKVRVTPASTSFSVRANQTAPADYRRSDLMTATTALTRGTAGTLTFQHLMAQLQVVVTVTPPVTEVLEVALVGGWRTIALTPASGYDAPPTLGTRRTLSDSGDLSDVIGDDDARLVLWSGTQTATFTAVGLVVPQQLPQSVQWLRITTNQGRHYYSIHQLADPADASSQHLDPTLRPGTAYSLTVTPGGLPTSGLTLSETAWQQQSAAVESTPSNLVFHAGSATFQMNFVKGGRMDNLYMDQLTPGAATGYNVELSDYYIGQTEVTQGLWSAVMGGLVKPDGNALAAQAGTGAQHPVGQVSWNMCYSDGSSYSGQRLFLDRLNTLLADQLPQGGWHFELPTSAQWEYAARGGQQSQGYKYAGSNTDTEVINTSNGADPVAQKKANELGLYDMHGSVWEVCRDWVDTRIASNASSATTPYCIATGGLVVVPDAAKKVWLNPLFNTETNPSDKACVMRGGSGTNPEGSSNYKYQRLAQNGALNRQDSYVGLRLALVKDGATTALATIRTTDPVGTTATYSHNGATSGEGSAQTATLEAGTYRIEAWGGEGGARCDNKYGLGGLGGYAGTVVAVGATTIFHIYCGGKGGDILPNAALAATDPARSAGAAGGWNGGGKGGNSCLHNGKYLYACAGGGGASHVAVASTAADHAVGAGQNLWTAYTDETSNTAQTGLVVVAGGGGGGGHSGRSGGNGGGLTGSTGVSEDNYFATNPWYSAGFASQGTPGGNGFSMGSSAEGSGGGGGGYVGGNAHPDHTTSSQNSSGCGGSSWLPASGTTISSGVTTTTAGATEGGKNFGSGRVVITKLSN